MRPFAGMERCAALLRCFARDEAGNYVLTTGLLLPVLIGAAGIGTEAGLWSQRQQNLQSAADSAAISAALSYNTGGAAGLITQARAVAADYGFVHGVGDVNVDVNHPPLSGKFAGINGAVEVVVKQQRSRLFSAVWSADAVVLAGRATALANGPATGCVLALDPAASGAITATGSTRVTLKGCSLYDNSSNASAMSVGGSARLDVSAVGVVGGISGAENITASNGITTGRSPVSDPYAKFSFPSLSGCTESNLMVKETVTLNPGVYCGGIKVNAGASVSLNPGVYFMDQGDLQISGNASFSGTGVTIVFTSSTGKNFATARINGGATVNLTAPTSGQTAGIVMFGDRRITDEEFRFEGGAAQIFGGAVYLPTAALHYAGGADISTGCTQIIAKTIKFTGNSNLTINCDHQATKSFGSVLANLVE
jgi:hypothetical protein